MPFCSGLGSSAASAVAAVFACNQLMKFDLSKLELLPFAAAGESLVSGGMHYDNIAPCMLGGMVLSPSADPSQIIQLPNVKSFWIVAVHPNLQIATKDARAVLPKTIKLKKAIQQSANLASFINAVHRKDFAEISRSMQDVLAEPYRAKLIPAFQKVKQAALKNGALACGISGAGPSMFALVYKYKNCSQIAMAMKKAFAKKNIAAQAFISKINTEGAKIVEDFQV
ncbi:UNVERIFIED_CONTAM: hypothetical protein GTU68_067197 [Idotea baltica]|nr:hypothetical protein [Idotea baltica]